MSYFFSLLVQGISVGFVIGLIALGFVIVFKATGVVNFAQAALVVLGAYTVGRLHGELGFWLALGLGIAVTAVAGALVHLVVIEHARRPDPARLAIITLGIAIVLGSVLRDAIGADVLTFGDPWGFRVIEVGDSFIPVSRIVAAVAAVVILVVFALAFRFSGWGVAMRAASEDSLAAALMGIRLRRVAIGAWALAGILATVSGVFFLTFPSSGVTNAAELAVLGAFPAAIIGGLDSTLGAVVGGLLVGLGVTFCAGYEQDLAFLGRGLAEVVPYAIMFVVLLVRPSGLFGTRELDRV